MGAASSPFSDDVAGVVLVDVQLSVEAEELRVGAEEALHVRLRRQRLELLVLERLQVLRADLRAQLDLRVVQTLADARLAEAVADLEHRAIVGPAADRLSAAGGGRRTRP